jgi:hypothetical protein
VSKRPPRHRLPSLFRVAESFSAEPNLMVAKLQAPIGSKARVAFSANLHGHSLTARYVTE